MDDPVFVPRSLEDLELEWPPEITHFSASSAKMAVRCEEQWRQRYILGKKSPPNLALIGGKADHAAIEQSMLKKITSFTDLPVKEVTEAFVESVEKEVDQAGGLSELEWKDDLDTEAARVREYDDLRTHGQRVVKAYHETASPLLQPIAVEAPIEILVPGLPVKVIGYIDLIANDAQLQIDNPFFDVSAQTRIIDRKRRKRASAKIEPEWSIQAEIYQLAHPLRHDWHISVHGTKTPSVMLPNAHPTLVQAVPSRERSERLLQQIVAKIGWLYQRYGPDDPWPTTGKLHPWACGFCAYRPACWGWA